MARGLNEFLKGLKFENSETSQIEIAEEAIKKHLFIVINELDLKNGQTVEMTKVVQLISDKLGIKGNKNKIEQIVLQVFQNGEYLHKINENGDIEANFSKAYILQKERDDKMHEEAEEVLHGFVQRVETYVEQLEQQKIKVTEFTLLNQFSEEDIQKNRSWIDLAINRVLEMQNQEK